MDTERWTDGRGRRDAGREDGRRRQESWPAQQSGWAASVADTRANRPRPYAPCGGAHRLREPHVRWGPQAGGHEGCRAVGMAGTSMRWQTGFSGRGATCQEGQNGARRGAASKWSGTGWGLPKEGLLRLSLQEESHWPEAHRGCLRGNSRRGGSSGAEGRAAQGVRGPGTAGPQESGRHSP